MIDLAPQKLKFIEPLVHEDIVSLREHMQEMEKVDIAFLEMVRTVLPAPHARAGTDLRLGAGQIPLRMRDAPRDARPPYL